MFLQFLHPLPGIHARLYEELIHHTLHCQRHTETFSGQTELLSEMETYLTSDKTTPLILHGDMGCGKSAMAAMASKLCDKVLPHSACVVRFVGASPESATLNRVLRSVCEQIAYLYGEHISTAAKVRMGVSGRVGWDNGYIYWEHKSTADGCEWVGGFG